MTHELFDVISGARAMIVICGVTHMPSIIQTLRTRFARVEQYDVTKLAWFDETLCKIATFGPARCGGRVLGPVTPYRLIQGVQRIRITPQAEGGPEMSFNKEV
jgi:hypothetical protein